MKNVQLGFFGYIFVIFSLLLELLESNMNINFNTFINIIEIISYFFILNSYYRRINEKVQHTVNHNKKQTKFEIKNLEIGHFILFLIYFYSFFLSGKPKYKITLVALISHLFLIDENSNFFNYGLMSSLIYYLIKFTHHINDINMSLKIKLISYALLAFYYFNHILELNFVNEHILQLLKFHH